MGAVNKGWTSTMEYTPSGAVSEGDVVVLGGGLIGVATSDIAANAKGALTVEGTFDMPKSSGSAGESIVIGAALYWNDSSDIATATASSNKFLGYAEKAAGASATSVRVRLSRFKV